MTAPQREIPCTLRYRPYTEYLRERFGGRLQKVSLDAGFDCPNRDGTVGRGGCTFCSNDAFVPGYARSLPTISEQIEAGIEFQAKRYPRNIGYLAYFQAYTNTHADTDQLDRLYREAAAHPQVRGLIIGTRPDCLDTPVLDLLVRWSARTEVFVELGVESCSDAVLAKVNRCHDFATSADAINRCHERGLRVGVHMIAGLPGETEETFREGATILSGLPIHSLKLHQLQIFKGTPLAKQLQHHPDLIQPLELERYLSLAAGFIARLRPDIYLERIGGEAPPRHVIGPSWGLRHDQLWHRFDAYLESHDIRQGQLWSG